MRRKCSSGSLSVRVPNSKCAKMLFSKLIIIKNSFGLVKKVDHECLQKWVKTCVHSELQSVNCFLTHIMVNNCCSCCLREEKKNRIWKAFRRHFECIFACEPFLNICFERTLTINYTEKGKKTWNKSCQTPQLAKLIKKEPTLHIKRRKPATVRMSRKRFVGQ